MRGSVVQLTSSRALPDAVDAGADDVAGGEVTMASMPDDVRTGRDTVPETQVASSPNDV